MKADANEIAPVEHEEKPKVDSPVEENKAESHSGEHHENSKLAKHSPVKEDSTEKHSSPVKAPIVQNEEEKSEIHNVAHEEKSHSA